MKIVESKCCARAGLLGNPSDGYHGKAISFAIQNFFAEVQLGESSALCFESAGEEPIQFVSLNAMAAEATFSDSDDGGNRLLQSALLRVLRHFPVCAQKDSPLFSAAFSSNIPRQVGMAGSSAIIIAAMKAYAQWFDIQIEPEFLASLALAAERDLGISAGLQDRVVQSLQGLVYMDFDETVIRTENELSIGEYARLDPAVLKNVYVAYASNMPESTDVLHSDLKTKYESGDVQVVSAINEIAELARQGKDAIANGEIARLADLINRNFELRRSICLLHPGHVQMVELARDCGASAKYCGSGGAVVGTYPDISVFEKLNQQMQSIDCVVFKPEIS